jgi:predicted HNH restriction endonuclease
MSPKLHEVLQLRHCSIRTEQSYGEWLRRYICIHHQGRASYHSHLGTIA